MLEYRRVAGKGREVAFTDESLDQQGEVSFVGERQLDMNRAVVQAVGEDGLWSDVVGGFSIMRP